MSFYFNNYSKWQKGLTYRCGTNLKTEHAPQRVKALKDPADRGTAEFMRF